MKRKQHETQQLRMEGTGKWFLEHKEYLEWKTNGRTLWVEGPSGTGKSVLSSMVVNELFTDQKRSAAGTIALAFFYFDFRNREAQSVEIALRRIVLQLSAQCPQPYELLDTHYKVSNGQNLPTYQDLQNLLCDLLRQLGHTYIVLDGLDESDASKFHQLVGIVLMLQAWTDTPLHLLITSQTRDIFTKKFGELAHITLQPNVMGNDIEFFVASQLNTNSNLEMWSSMQNLGAQITLKSNGMFRLAACLLIELSQCSRKAELDETLRNLPDDLFSVYDRFLQNIRPKDLVYVKAILHWLMFANDVLSLELLGDAISFNFSGPGRYIYRPDEREDNVHAIPKWLAGLILIDNTGLKLAHASVQDYLLSDHFKEKFHTDLSEHPSHSFIFRTCHSYLLSCSNPPQTKTELEGNPLAKYAAIHWYHHLKNSNNLEALLPLAMQILEDGSTHYNFCMRVTAEWMTPQPPLIFCCQIGYCECVLYLLQNREECPSLEEALQVAAISGQMDIVHLLLEQGADINKSSALYWAASYGHLAIVHLLVEKGAEINGKEYSALSGACGLRYGRIAVFLLDNGADPNWAGKWGKFPLAAAAGANNQYMVRLLLEKGANVNMESQWDGNALGVAARAGKIDMVHLLLQNGANIEFAGGPGSALVLAATEGHMDVVHLLLENGADINWALDFYGNALSMAAANGHTSIVNVLLEKGADINLTGMHSENALCLAASNGHLAMVRLLLEEGADINWAVSICMPPLVHAAGKGHLDIVSLLLEKGAEINPIPEGPLASAAAGGHSDIVHLLLEKGADLNPPYRVKNPLNSAARGGHMDIVCLLLNKGADINPVAHDSPLASAAYWGHMEIVCLLLEKGADVNPTACQCPLAMAAWRGHIDIVQLLLKNGANVNGGKYDNPLESACSNRAANAFDIVHLLLENGAEYCDSALEKAIEHKNDRVIALLREQIATLDAV
ncbi:ankyrin repeat-containing domain protein [Mycena olivaceomarginata]|nr:ankyrin repeat-containing domain protein [Mycena olivaceomarginata]